MRVRDPVGVEWEVSRRRRAGFTWVVETAFDRGERTFSPAGARRLLPESPLSSHEQRNVRVLS